jgi:hypothetical protein
MAFSIMMIASHDAEPERHCGSKLRSSMKFFCQPHIKEMIRNGFFGPFTKSNKRAARKKK